MKRKLLSILLTFCLAFSLLPTSALAEGETVTLQSQIATSGTVTLDKDYTEDITIPSGADVTLDLNGKTLSNTNNSKATLSVEGTAVVKNGTINGGTGYYNIEVKTGGSLTLENVTATAGNNGSSMIDNWGTLTITSGTYTGGLNVVKSEPEAKLTIFGGSFELQSAVEGYTAVVLNYGDAEISGGTYLQSATTPNWAYPQVVMNGQDGDSAPNATVTGGMFTNKHSRGDIFRGYGKATSASFQVSDGTFNKKVKSSFLAEGKVCKKNTTTGMYELTTGATGVTLNETEKTIKVGESFKLEATLTPENAELKSVEWTSTKKSIATVTNGVVKGVAIGDVTIKATPTAAGATPATCTVHVYDEAAQIGETKYSTFEDAFKAAKENDTITLLKNISLKTTIEISKSVTLDLGGFTVTGPKVEVKSGQSKWYEYIALKVTDGTVTIKNGTVSGRVNVYDAANVTIEKDVTIKNKCYNSSTSGYGIVVWGDGAYGQEDCKTPILNIYGKVNVTGNNGVAISTNGTDKSKPIINVYDGAEITSAKCSGIYLPSGALTVSGGTITGATGIYFKSTDMTISGGKIIGNGAKAGYEFNGNGANTTGDALVIDNCNYPNGIGNVEVTGGNFASMNAKAVGSYAGNGQTEPLVGFVTGGLFSSDPSAYCAAGMTGVASGNSQYPYTVGDKDANAKPAHVDTATVPAKTTSNDDTVKNVASEITGANVTNNAAEAATKDLANKNKLKGDSVLEDNTTVVGKLNGVTSAGTTEADVAIVYQTYVDVTVTDVKTENSTVTEITVDLTPMYRVVATTSDVVNSNQDIKVDRNNGANAVVIQEGKKLDLPEQEYEVKLALPNGFAAAGDKLSIKHTKDNGTIEYYTGVVSEESSKLYVTFTTKGFSPFTISAPAASIGETMYPTLAEAIAKAANGNTVKLEKNCEESVSVSGKSLTIDKNNYVYDFTNVTVDSNSTKTENGDTLTITYTAPSSSSGSSGYYVSTPSKTENGTVTVSPRYADKGDTVTVTVKPDSGYVLETLTVTDKNGNELTLKDKGNGKYTFTMPSGKVEVKATFMEDNSMLNFFYDVPNNAYFYEAVKWAVKNGITDGVGNNLFAPEQPCTRAQIVTFLWRAAGSPEPKGAASGMTDVVSGGYYEKAVAWAIENGITTGTTTSTFSPDATCTRAQAVTFLARALNAKAASAAEFSDVPTGSYFADAVAWAAANGVTEGIGGGLFGSDNDCTRGQIVTFLYRAYNK